MKFEGASHKSEHIDNSELTRRQILESLAAITAVGAMGVSPEAKAESNSFPEWKRNMENSPRSKYVEHSDTHLENGGFDYRLRGVTHIPETLVKNFDAIEKEIENSSAVMLEYFGPGMTTYANGPIEMAAQVVAGGEGDLKKDVEANLFIHQEEEQNASFGLFFGTVAGMAGRKGKDIFVVNPQNPAVIEQSDMGTRLSKIGIGLGVATVAGVAVEMKNHISKTGGETLSRRDFLRRGAIGAVGISTGVPILKQQHLERLESDWRKIQAERLKKVQEGLAALQENGLINETDSPEIQANKLVWCMNDWRNAVTALGILQMNQHDTQVQNNSEKYLNGDGPLVHFEGAMHVGVQDFLRNPTLTKERVNYYNDTFNEDGTLSIRRFRFNQETEKFDLVSDDPIIYAESDVN